MFARLKPYFKAKYFWSVFLVCGVLSISIGTPPAKDPLIAKGEELTLEFGHLFCVSKKPTVAADQSGVPQLSCGEKDPAILTEAEMDGPGLNTLDETDEGMKKFLAKFEAYGKLISEASDKRAAAAYAVKTATERARANAALVGVIGASKVYFTLQQQLFANYLRLAHESPFEMYRRTSFGSKLMNWHLGRDFGDTDADRREFEEKNAKAIRLKAATVFKKDRYDGYNLKLNSDVAAEFFFNEGHGLRYNIRHVKAPDGSFQKTELFLNEEDKRLIEYASLGDPRSKGEYVKLLQFAAIRESLVNRWALRRLVSYDIYDAERRDKPVAACAPELISYRLPKASKISDAEMYKSLWQKDRYNSFITKIEPIAQGTHHNKFYGPLLMPEAYADLVLVYLEQFPSFRSAILPAYVGREKELYAIISQEPQYAPGVADQEHLSWSKIDPANGMSVAREVFMTMNLPADSLEPVAVAERMAWKTYELRKRYLIEALTEMARVMGLPEAKTMFAPKKAVETVESFMAQCGYPGMDAKSGCSRERVWKNGMHAFLEKVVKENHSQNYPFIKEQAKIRYDEFLSGIRPLAVKGALGYQVRTAAEKLLEDYKRKRKWNIGPTNVPSDSHAVSDGRSMMRVKVSPKEYYLAKVNALKSDDLTPYVENIPFRQSWKRYGLKQFAAPSTPEQIRSFFFKKLELVIANAPSSLMKEFEKEQEKNAERSYAVAPKKFAKPASGTLNQYGLAEEHLAIRIRSNPAVMEGMEIVFGKIAEAYAQAAQNADPGKNIPAVVKMAAKANKAGQKKAADSCQKVFVQPQASTPTQAKGAPKRGPAQEPANLDSAATQEVCVAPPVDEEAANAKLLESVLIGAAKAGYQEFLVQMEKAPQYKNPERAKKGLDKASTDLRKKMQEMPRAARDNTYVAPRIPTPLLVKKPAVKPTSAPVAKRKFRAGKDQTFAKTENKAYVIPEGRDEAKYLMTEALAMIGLGSAATGERWGTSTKIWFRPHRVLSWLMTEHFIERQLPGASLLVRMAGTALDQVAIGQALEQEAYARAPILAIQPSWNAQSEKDSPNFLTRVQKHWSPQKGWDLPAFDKVFREILVAAVRNDVDKVETYCRADIRNYQDDIDFRNMFNSSSGLRAALSEIDGVAKWDAEVQKEARSLRQIVLQDYIDPYGMYIFIGMMLIIAWQIAPLILSVMHASTLAAAMQVVGGAVGKLTISRVFWLMVTGNLAPVNVIFTTQTVLMISVYMYQIPVQIEHHFQVANSQITRTSLPGYLLDRSFVDREKMQAMRAELNTNQNFTKFAVVAEAAAFAGFTVPAALKTLGFTGSRKLAQLSKGLDPKILNDAKVPSLGELVKEHGGMKAMQIYMGRVGIAMKSLNRIPSVLPGTASRAALYEATAAQLARQFKNRDDFIRFLQTAKDDVLKDARAAFGVADDAKDDLFQLGLKQMEKRIEVNAISDLNGAGQKFAQRMEGLTEEDFVTVIMDRRFRRLKESQDLSFAAREAKVLQKVGEAEALAAEARMFDEMIALAKTAPTEPGAPELSVFFRNMVKDGEIEKLRKYYMKYRKQIFDMNTRDEVFKVWKSLDYLSEDWGKITQYIGDKRRRAVTFVQSTGRADIFINDDGLPEVVQPKIFIDNSEEYDVYAIPKKRFTGRKRKTPPKEPYRSKAQRAADEKAAN